MGQSYAASDYGRALTGEERFLRANAFVAVLASNGAGGARVIGFNPNMSSVGLRALARTPGLSQNTRAALTVMSALENPLPAIMGAEIFGAWASTPTLRQSLFTPGPEATLWSGNPSVSSAPAPQYSSPIGPQSYNTTRFVVGQEVTDIRTGNVFTGTIDLKPTLDRIRSGGSYPHPNDGTIFRNKIPRGAVEPGLPVKPRGYYNEYVHPTPGINRVGPQRIVTGNGGERYYTPDHYETFINLNP